MGDLLILPTDDRRWMALAARAPAATAFHHPAWATMLADCYGFRPFVAALGDGRDGLRAGVPVVEVRSPLRRPQWVSLPFSDHCAVLASSDRDRRALVDRLLEAGPAQGAGGVELRDPAPAPGPASSWWHRLALSSDVDRLFDGLGPSHRRNVRAARRNRLVVREGAVAEDLLDRYWALHIETRRRQGTPAQPKRYFRFLWERVIEPGIGRILLAEHDGRPVAGIVLLAWGSTVTYKYGASSTADLRLRPNDLLLWEAMSWAARAGYSTFDLGRTAAANDGLVRFKRGWGAEETCLQYLCTGTRADHAGRGEVGGVAKVVLQHSPRSAVRLAGALLYRYAA